MPLLVRVVGQRLVVVLAGTLRIEGEVELIPPAELVAGLAHRVVTEVGRGVSLRQVGRVGCELVGHHALTYVLALGETEVLLLRHVAEHGRTEVPDHSGADSARDVVVARADIRD